MRFYRDRPEVIVPVRYYFVPEGTPYAAVETPFQPRYFWDPEGVGWPDDELGEVWTGRVRIVRPLTVGDADPAGGPCGTREEWANGFAAPSAAHTPCDALGTPLCCRRRGLVTGCEVLIGGGRSTYLVNVSGITDGACQCAVGLTGSWPINYFADCIWTGTLNCWCGSPTVVDLILELIPGNQLLSVAFAGDGFSAEYSAEGDWDGASPLVLQLFSGGGKCGWPPTITITAP